MEDESHFFEIKHICKHYVQTLQSCLSKNWKVCKVDPHVRMSFFASPSAFLTWLGQSFAAGYRKWAGGPERAYMLGAELVPMATGLTFQWL